MSLEARNCSWGWWPVFAASRSLGGAPARRRVGAGCGLEHGRWCDTTLRSGVGGGARAPAWAEERSEGSQVHVLMHVATRDRHRRG